MRKVGLLNMLAELKVKADDEAINDINRIKVLDLLLDYINDEQIREAVERIPI